MMKIYIVFSCDIEIPKMDKGFLDESKAKEYVDDKNKQGFIDWWYEETEVVE